MEHIKNDFGDDLNFVCDLYDKPFGFGKPVLDLLSKYYGYNHMLFVPLPFESNGIKSMYIHKLNYLGFSERSAAEYAKDFYPIDPFKLTQLPRRFHGERIVTMHDILEYNTHNTAYMDFLHKNNLSDHMCAYMIDGDTYLGGICLFKENGTGSFKDSDINAMDEKMRFITRYYCQSLNLNIESFKKTMYKNFFDITQTGMIFLDAYFNVLDYNEAADNFCQQISEHSESTVGLEGLTDNFLLSHTDNRVEQVIRYILSYYKMSTDKEIIIENNAGKYSIKINASVIPSKFFRVQSVYLISIDKKSDKIFKKEVVDFNLTPRELEIAWLVAQGHSNQKIADMLNISPHTSKTHIKKIFQKVGITSRTELAYKLYGC